MWYPFFLECCAHSEYLGNCCSSLKVSLCTISSGRPSLRTSLQEVKLCFTAIPLVSRLWYFLSPLHWVTPSYSSQYPWHQGEVQDLVEWMNDTTRPLLLQLLSQDSLDFSICCLSSFGSGYLKFCLDFNLFALCVWGKQIQPTRSMVTSFLAFLGQLQLCYWSSEVDCTFGKSMGRRWRLEEAGFPSPSIPLFLHWILDILPPTICCLEMSLQRG